MLIMYEGKYNYWAALEIRKKFKFPVLSFPPTARGGLIETFQARDEQISP